MVRRGFGRLGRGVGITCAIAAAAGGVAWAAGTVGGAPQTMVQACVNKTNGDVRIVGDNTSDCRQSEQPMAWAAAGTAGIPGKDGAAGKDGTSVTSATATTLPPGSDATASFEPATGLLALGIPQGVQGPPGVAGQDGTSVTSVTATTLAPDAAATADFDPSTGAMSLGIPRGEPGADGSDDGTHVVARGRLAAPVAFPIVPSAGGITLPAFPLAGGAWTQQPGEVDMVVGGTVSYDVTPRGDDDCDDMLSVGAAGFSWSSGTLTPGSHTARLGSDGAPDGFAAGATMSLFEPDAATPRTLTANAREFATNGSINCDVTITAIDVDVVAFD